MNWRQISGWKGGRTGKWRIHSPLRTKVEKYMDDDDDDDDE
jgi:hypothetical protein